MKVEYWGKEHQRRQEYLLLLIREGGGVKILR
jgi:hypothetical protein